MVLFCPWELQGCTSVCCEWFEGCGYVMVIKYPSRVSPSPLTYERTVKLVCLAFSFLVGVTVSGFLHIPCWMNHDGYWHLFSA